VLFLFIIILTATSSDALNFTLESPGEVDEDDSFRVEILTEEEINNSYDVKIFVHKDNKESSEIKFDGEWKSPFYYLEEAYPEEDKFKITAYYIGDTKICARLRPSGTDDFSEVCNDITVLEAPEEEPEPEVPEPEVPEPEVQEIIKKVEEPIQPITNLAINNDDNKNQEIISLTSKKPVVEQPIIIESKKKKTHLTIIYGFTLICVIIIIILSLHKL
jgi:hypothetical protein